MRTIIECNDVTRNGDVRYVGNIYLWHRGRALFLNETGEVEDSKDHVLRARNTGRCAKAF